MGNRRGYSLIEIIITIAVAAILFVGLSRAAQNLIKSVIDNRNNTIAFNIAKYQMSVMNNAAYPAVVAETAQTADPAFPSFIPTQEVVSVAVSGSYSIRQITVRVRLNSISGAVLIRLDTYRTNLATFGDGL